VENLEENLDPRFPSPSTGALRVENLKENLDGHCRRANQLIQISWVDDDQLFQGKAFLPATWTRVINSEQQQGLSE